MKKAKKNERGSRKCAISCVRLNGGAPVARHALPPRSFARPSSLRSRDSLPSPPGILCVKKKEQWTKKKSERLLVGSGRTQISWWGELRRSIHTYPFSRYRQLSLRQQRWQLARPRACHLPPSSPRRGREQPWWRAPSRFRRWDASPRRLQQPRSRARLQHRSITPASLVILPINLIPPHNNNLNYC